MFLKDLRKLAARVYHKIWCEPVYHLRLNAYWLGVPLKVKRMRRKASIRVLFVVSELASWKSELLYQAMRRHERFCPIIGVSTSSTPSGAKDCLVSYLSEKGYDYIDLDASKHSIRKALPDIIFYYKPYPSCYSRGHFFNKHLNRLLCGFDYCFEITTHAIHLDKELYDYCWQFYVENPDLVRRRREVLGYRARNTMLTGVPMQDLLLMPKVCFADPWKSADGRKRIIYAPHHSFQGTNSSGIEFATFLTSGVTVLELAKKYSDCIVVAFKPHPNLYMKLCDNWGRERTDAYYNDWSSLPNAQVETGEYAGLFKYSDAIIHDCASFLIEYLYMDNPSMYLVAETNNPDDMLEYARDGYTCYEHGRSADDIERFILDVIHGKDNKKEKRQAYINNRLMPPGGQSACNNIINAILGNKWE